MDTKQEYRQGSSRRIIWRCLTVTVLFVVLASIAAPAGAFHGDGSYCIDSSDAAFEDPMLTDTPAGYCVVESAGRGFPHATGEGDQDAEGADGSGAVPTRIDAGAGATARTGNPLLLGAVLTGATAALAAGAARRRRRS